MSLFNFMAFMWHLDALYVKHNGAYNSAFMFIIFRWCCNLFVAVGCNVGKRILGRGMTPIVIEFLHKDSIFACCPLLHCYDMSSNKYSFVAFANLTLQFGCTTIPLRFAISIKHNGSSLVAIYVLGVKPVPRKDQ